MNKKRIFPPYIEYNIFKVYYERMHNLVENVAGRKFFDVE